jgi:hypothetical protein
MITPSFSLTATERVLPKLTLDFTSASLDARVTLTRTGNTAYKTNSSGLLEPVNADTPRFDYDPLTLVCKGLLIEEQRTNNIFANEDLTSGLWSRAGCTVSADDEDAPDGNTTADKLIMNNGIDPTGANGNGVTSTNAVTSGVYTYSFYAKAGEHTSMRVRENVSFGSFLTVNLLTGAVSANIGGGSQFTNVRSVNVGNGWWRVSFTTPTMTNVDKYTFRSNVTGDGTSGFYLWGIQCELGSFSTSYIKTGNNSVTRNADVATMTGTNFSDWYSAGSGGLAILVLPSTVSGTRPAIQFDDNTADEIIALRGNTTNPELVIVEGGAGQAQIDAGTIAANTVYNLGAAWATDDCAAAVNGGAAVTDTTATIPTVTQARLGSDGTNYLNGHLQSIRYWPQRIIDAEVRAFSK